MAELVVAGAIGAFVIGLTTMPMIQMKRMEGQVDFQSQLQIAHQIALQQAAPQERFRRANPRDGARLEPRPPYGSNYCHRNRPRQGRTRLEDRLTHWQATALGWKDWSTAC